MYTNRSRLVRVLESTEAMHAVSLSALAYAVTWPSPITIKDAPHRHCLVHSKTNWWHRWWPDCHATTKGHESDTVMCGHGPADPPTHPQYMHTINEIYSQFSMPPGNTMIRVVVIGYDSPVYLIINQTCLIEWSCLISSYHHESHGVACECHSG